MKRIIKSQLRTWTTDGDMRLSALLWAVFLYPVILWLSEYWLAETRTIVEWTLLFVTVTEMMFPRTVVLKRMLQMLAIIVVNIVVLDIRVATIPLDTWSDVLPWLAANLNPFHPFIWFNLFVSAAYVLTLTWTKGGSGKIRTLVVIGAAIVAMCIVDSFTFFILWRPISIMIISGLLLVIISHFKQFRDEHPESWSYIVEYPGTVLVPVVLLLTVMMVAGSLAPQVRPLLTDPYTAWKQYRGEEVVKLGKGLESVISFETSSSSGYSRSDEELGGGFLYDFSEVMRVDTTARSYWRGETRSLYTGIGWEQGDADTNAEIQPVQPGVELARSQKWDTSRLETVQIEQTFTITSDTVFPVLFNAYSPITVTAAEQSDTPEWEGNLDWAPDSHELRYSGEQSYPTTFSVVSEMPVLDEDRLREAYGDELRDVLDEFDPSYLQLPETLPQRVVDLAEEIAGEADNVYDRVKAIEQYLYLEYPYTNQPDESGATSADFVDRFLFEVREGYCDYYSTAMVVMVRSLGIPARWVKGYRTGQAAILSEYDVDTIPYEYYDFIIERTDGEFVVRNSDAHSWVEVYFPGSGWIPFEPTSGFVIPYADPTEEEDTFVSAMPELPPMESIRSDSGDGKPFSWGMVTAILAGLAVVGLFLTRRKWAGLRPALAGFRVKKTDTNRTIIKEVEKFLAYASRKGMARRDHQTMREWMYEGIGKYRWMELELTQLVRLFERAKYKSDHPLPQADAEQTKQLVRSLREKMK